MIDFSKKAILVTGSTRGIGLAAAKKLSECGATVGYHGRDINQVMSICSSMPDSVPLSADLTSPREAAALVKEFVSKTGKIDGVVNNAGSGRALAFRGVTLKDWRETFNLNLEAAMIASQEAYILMRKNKCGSIVNIASLAAHGPGKWMGADYAAAKAGLVSLTKSLAFEAARFNIRVNAVSPGFIETDMTSRIPENTRKAIDIPMDRFGTPAEIARIIMFLLADSSEYITGQVIHADGGLWMGP